MAGEYGSGSLGGGESLGGGMGGSIGGIMGGGINRDTGGGLGGGLDGGGLQGLGRDRTGGLDALGMFTQSSGSRGPGLSYGGEIPGDFPDGQLSGRGLGAGKNGFLDPKSIFSGRSGDRNGPTLLSRDTGRGGRRSSSQSFDPTYLSRDSGRNGLLQAMPFDPTQLHRDKLIPLNKYDFPGRRSHRQTPINVSILGGKSLDPSFCSNTKSSMPEIKYNDQPTRSSTSKNKVPSKGHGTPPKPEDTPPKAREVEAELRAKCDPKTLMPGTIHGFHFTLSEPELAKRQRHFGTLHGAALIEQWQWLLLWLPWCCLGIHSWRRNEREKCFICWTDQHVITDESLIKGAWEWMVHETVWPRGRELSQRHFEERRYVGPYTYSYFAWSVVCHPLTLGLPLDINPDWVLYESLGRRRHHRQRA